MGFGVSRSRRTPGRTRCTRAGGLRRAGRGRGRSATDRHVLSGPGLGRGLPRRAPHRNCGRHGPVRGGCSSPGSPRQQRDLFTAQPGYRRAPARVSTSMLRGSRRARRLRRNSFSSSFHRPSVRHGLCGGAGEGGSVKPWSTRPGSSSAELGHVSSPEPAYLMAVVTDHVTRRTPPSVVQHQPCRIGTVEERNLSSTSITRRTNMATMRAVQAPRPGTLRARRARLAEARRRQGPGAGANLRGLPLGHVRRGGPHGRCHPVPDHPGPPGGRPDRRGGPARRAATA